MKLFPAIDLRDGKVVRLHKGDFKDETIYGDDPVAVAKSFVDAGAEWIHVVDLDAAKTGNGLNRPIVAAIASQAGAAVQTGGGIRDRATAEVLLDAGVARIVLGTIAIEKPGLVRELAAAYPGCIAVGLDGRAGQVAVHGWLEGAGVGVVDTVRRYEDAEIAAFIVTDIERDGTLGGPDIAGLTEALASTNADVIASGGVGTLHHLQLLAGVDVGGKRLSGAIVGKALYEGKFTCAAAVRACEGQT